MKKHIMMFHKELRGDKILRDSLNGKNQSNWGKGGLNTVLTDSLNETY